MFNEQQKLGGEFLYLFGDAGVSARFQRQADYVVRPSRHIQQCGMFLHRRERVYGRG